MKIKLTSIYVNDQERALRFYTEVAGFVKKADFVDDVQREYERMKRLKAEFTMPPTKVTGRRLRC